MTNLIQIAGLILGLTNFVEFMEPADAGVWYTNYAGTNLVVSGVATQTALLGPAVLLYWEPAPEPVVVQWSEDLVGWQDLRVRHVGATNWWAYPFGTRFYRLRADP